MKREDAAPAGVKRRTILLGSASIAGAYAVGYSALLAIGTTQDCVADETQAALAQRAALANLGASYLAQASAGERAELFDIAQKPLTTVARFAGLMAAHAQEDFENGNVVSCDGWILARGEARSCALVALVHARLK